MLLNSGRLICLKNNSENIESYDACKDKVEDVECEGLFDKEFVYLSLAPAKLQVVVVIVHECKQDVPEDDSRDYSQETEVHQYSKYIIL